MVDLKKALADYHDYLAPRLDALEQIVYLHVFRHTLLVGTSEAVVSFKADRRKLGLNLGEKGQPLTEGACYERLLALQSKGCLEVLGTSRDGTRLRVKVPSEIPGLVPAGPREFLEKADFYNDPENRRSILKREKGKCFLCLRAIDTGDFEIAHVGPLTEGRNGYRNVLACCRDCAARKGDTPAEPFLRVLYRNGFLAGSELEARLAALQRLRNGELPPDAL
jgi:hypothetical protein